VAGFLLESLAGFVGIRTLLTLIEKAMGKAAYRGEATDEPEGEVVLDEAEILELA
jgi:hypothetical protein